MASRCPPPPGLLAPPSSDCCGESEQPADAMTLEKPVAPSLPRQPSVNSTGQQPAFSALIVKAASAEPSAATTLPMPAEAPKGHAVGAAPPNRLHPVAVHTKPGCNGSIGEEEGRKKQQRERLEGGSGDAVDTSEASLLSLPGNSDRGLFVGGDSRGVGCSDVSADGSDAGAGGTGVACRPEGVTKDGGGVVSMEVENDKDVAGACILLLVCRFVTINMCCF